MAGVRQEQDSADKPVWLSLDQCSAVTGQGTPAGQYDNIHVRVGGPGGGSESPQLVMIFALPPNFINI